MIQTLPLSTIVRKWRDLLVASDEIRAFCVEHYGKPAKVYVGVNAKRPPTEADCPYIVIRPGVKEEGELPEFTYVLSVGWVVRNDEATETAATVEQDGVYECDELGQLIYGCLAEASDSSPVTQVRYEIEPIDFAPQFVGEMQLEIAVTPTIGGAITY